MVALVVCSVSCHMSLGVEPKTGDLVATVFGNF